MPKKKAVRVGDVFRIHLPKGRYAFGCVLRDASVGIYPGIYPTPSLPADLPQSRFAFVTGIYSDVLPSGICPVVGHRTFQTEDDEWPPPCAVGSRLYYKGRFTPCKPEDVVGLELAQVCELDHIINRILNTQREVETP